MLSSQSQDRGRPSVLGIWGALPLLFGASVAQLLPALPPIAVSVCLVASATGVATRWRTMRLPALAVAGFAWAMWRGAIALDVRIPTHFEGRDIELVGTVVGLPRSVEGSTRFELRVETARLDDQPIDLRGDVRLAWYQGRYAPHPGQQLRAIARLKRPRGVANPGGADFERYALERRLAATGYVRTAQALDPSGAGLDDVRERFSHELARRLGPGSVACLLRALSVGDQSALSDADWEILRATGTTHLVAISGFHVGVVAGLGALLARMLIWLWPALALQVPRQQSAALLAVLAATGYSAVAGFSLPVARTLLMIAVLALSRVVRRRAGPATGLALALWVLLLFDPLAVLGAGFWLSFAGVAWLSWCLSGRVRRERPLPAFGRTQWAVSLGLLPLSLWFFQQCSIVGPFANLFAIPWITLVVVPLLLLAFGAWLVVPVAFGPLLTVTSACARAIWYLLERCAEPAWTVQHLPQPSLWALLLACAGGALMLLPRGVGARSLGAFALLPALLAPASTPPPKSLDLVQIDVGQGLSVLVRTANHSLLFDTGAGFAGGWDMGEAAVVPALVALGLRRLDVLVVSHGDNDHAGGAQSVVAAFRPRKVWRSDRKDGAPTCESGGAWEWDGVRFEFLHPPAHFPYLRNASSCVLRVSAGTSVVLLPGDIPADIEARLLREQGERLPSTVLFAPHHGSAGSSSAAFLERVRPQLVFVSAGHRSRFGHPHPQALARYGAVGAQVAGSAESGMLSLRLGPDGAVGEPRRYRQEFARYWRE